MTKIFKRSQGYSEFGLFYRAYQHLVSAETLFNARLLWSPTLFSAGYLCHLSCELILKACILYEKDFFPNIHVLTKLKPYISFISLNEKQQEKLEDLDNRYYLRYPLDDKQQGECEEISFSQYWRTTPDGAGTQDLINTKLLLKIISSQMPAQLSQTYAEAFSRVEISY